MLSSVSVDCRPDRGAWSVFAVHWNCFFFLCCWSIAPAPLGRLPDDGHKIYAQRPDALYVQQLNGNSGAMAVTQQSMLIIIKHRQWIGGRAIEAESKHFIIVHLSEQRASVKRPTARALRAVPHIALPLRVWLMCSGRSFRELFFLALIFCIFFSNSQASRWNAMKHAVEENNRFPLLLSPDGCLYIQPR